MSSLKEFGIFLPIANGGWIVSRATPPLDGGWALNRDAALLAEEQGFDFVMAMGKWRGKPTGRIVLRGESGRGPWESVIDVGGVAPSAANAALASLWAREAHDRFPLLPEPRPSHGVESNR